jgi:hypothetical protein
MKKDIITDSTEHVPQPHKLYIVRLHRLLKQKEEVRIVSYSDYPKPRLSGQARPSTSLGIISAPPQMKLSAIDIYLGILYARVTICQLEILGLEMISLVY